MPVLQELEKWVASPLSIIKDLFNRGENGDGWWGINEFFESKLKEHQNFASVPFLNSANLNSLPDGCLVRYTGMVQDQFDPEFYFKIYHTVNDGTTVQTPRCGVYSDLTLQASEEVDWDNTSNTMADRQTLYCVPIPGECQWVKEAVQAQCSVGQPPVAATGCPVNIKRKYDEGESDDTMAMEDEGEEPNEGEEFQAKKKCSTQRTCEETTSTHDLNFPVPDEKGLPCLVKLYREFDAFKVGEVVDVVGVLGTDPFLAPLTYTESSENEQLMDTAAERRAHCPPPSLVPRLHAMVVRHPPHSNPLLPRDLSFPLQPDTIPKFVSLPGAAGGVESCRAVLLDILTQALAGDGLAAEYTLLHLLSSVYGRTDCMALGKFSLNLSGSLGHIRAPALYQLLQSVLTKCFLLPLTLENMNSWRFTPKKDYNSNRLLSAVLQLSPGTEVLVDETVLTPGQLTQVGVANLTALGNVIQWQKLSYDFQFHTTEFDCDLAVLILSDGKSMVKVDCHVPVVPCGAAMPAVPEPSLELVASLRQYVTLCRGLEYALTSEMKERLEEDFVRLRSVDPQANGQQFHHLLCTARLLSLSNGCSTLTPQCWAHTCQLEKQRGERLKNNV